MILLVGNFVYAIGFSNPSPTSLQLLKGEEGRFVFQIQSVANPQDLICNYGVKGETPLIVEFDDDETFVGAGGVKDILGTITAPKDIEYGIYNVKFCVNCGNAVAVSEGASSVKTSACDLPIDVEIVEVRTRGNIPLPPKPAKVPYLLLILIVIILIAIGVIIYYMYKRRKR